MVAGDELRVVIFVSVDGGADEWQFGQQVHGVFKVVVPVFGLIGACLVSPEELALRLQMQQTHRQHRHRVKLSWHFSDECSLGPRQSSPVLPVFQQTLQLLISGIAACQQKKEHHLGQRLSSAWSFLRSLTKLRNGVSPESDPADGVKTRSIVEHDWQAAHAKHCVIDLHIRNYFITMEFAQVRKF